MTRKEAVQQFFTQVREAYIEDQKAKGIRASGKSADSLRVEADSDQGKLYGASYIYFQTHGRKPGGFPPIEAILQWIKDKGITADIPDKSLAFLIARKIAKKGTDIFMRKRPGLSVEDKITEARKTLVENILRGNAVEVLNKIKNGGNTN